MTVSSRKKSCALVGAGFLVSVLVACSGPADVEPIAGATARLDTLTGEVVMPLDMYRLDSINANMTLFERAESIAIGGCMEQRGYTYSAADVVEDPAAWPGDRPFGIWNIEQVRQFGGGFAPSLVEKAKMADAANGGADWEQVEKECYESIAVPVGTGTAEHDVQYPEELSFMPTNADYNESLARRLADQALGSAYEDERFVAARKPYSECLSSNGLTPAEDLGTWGPMESADIGSAEDLRISLIDAQCNVDTGLTQNLANILAEYEQGAIEANEAALAKAAADIAERVTAARNYVAENG